MIVFLKVKKLVKLNVKKVGYGMLWSFLLDSYGVFSVNVSFCLGLWIYWCFLFDVWCCNL